MMPEQPSARPTNPRFSSGPCAKPPTWSLDALRGASLGRSLVFTAEHGTIWLSAEPADAPDDSVPVLTKGNLYK